MNAIPSPHHDLLDDVLFRPTTDGVAPAAVHAHARRLGQDATGAPALRESVAGRSRAAILLGAGRAIQASGSKLSMSQVAAAAGVAKATLYNHFRTREDVLNSLLMQEIDRVIVAVAHLELSAALTRAATAVSEHPLLEALGAHDLQSLAELGRVDVRSPGWARVAEATDALLRRSGRGGTPTVLRWLSSFVVAPADEDDIRADVEILVHGLPPLRTATR